MMQLKYDHNLTILKEQKIHLVNLLVSVNDMAINFVVAKIKIQVLLRSLVFLIISNFGEMKFCFLYNSV